MNNGKNKALYLRPATIQRTYDISNTFLLSLAKEKKVRSILTPGGNHLYHKKDLESQFRGESSEQRTKIAYCRVSSQHQRDDLERQVAFVQQRHPCVEIFRDVGSGINFKKKGLQKVLQKIMSRSVEELIITDKDRLCRFGYELFETLCDFHGTKIMVLHQEYTDGERELADDLLTICNVFVARKNGQRAARNRRLRKEEIEENKARETKD